MSARGQGEARTLRDVSTEDMAEWINKVLAGHEPRVSGEKEEEPYSYLIEVYEELSGSVREVFQDAVLRLLAGIVPASGDSMVPPFANDLLLLSEGIFSGSERRQRVLPLLHQFVGAGTVIKQRSLHRRVVQTLVALHYQAPARFWRELFLHHGDDYAAATFSGLSLGDLGSAFSWVTEHAANPRVLEALLGRLPYLLQSRPADGAVIREGIHQVSRYLPRPLLERLIEYTQALDIELRASAFLGWTDEEIERLGKLLGVFEEDESATPQERLSILAETLRRRAPEPIRDSAGGSAAPVVFAACEALLRIAHEVVPIDIVNRLVDSVPALEESVLPRATFDEVFIVACKLADKAHGGWTSEEATDGWLKS